MIARVAFLTVAVSLAVAVAGCATPTEREIARLEDEIEEYVERDIDRLEELDRRFANAEAKVQEAREREIAAASAFREDLLAQVREARRAAVKEHLNRQLSAANDSDARKRLQRNGDRLEQIYRELEEATDRATAALVKARADARDEQLMLLAHERIAKRAALEERRRAFILDRQGRIAALKRDLEMTSLSAAGDVAAPAAPGKKKGARDPAARAEADGPAGSAPPEVEGAPPLPPPAPTAGGGREEESPSSPAEGSTSGPEEDPRR